jgi:hypothetical protein
MFHDYFCTFATSFSIPKTNNWAKIPGRSVCGLFAYNVTQALLLQTDIVEERRQDYNRERHKNVTEEELTDHFFDRPY